MEMFWKQFITKSFLLFVSQFFLFQIFCQYNPEEIDKVKEKYKGNRVILLKKEIRYSLSIESNGLEVKLHELNSYLYLKDVSVHETRKSVFSSNLTELENSQATVYTLESGKYKKKLVPERKEVINTKGNNFHDDIKEYSYDFGNVVNGDIIEIRTTHNYKEPRLLTTIFFGEYFPIADMKLIIESDKNIHLKTIDEFMDKVDYDYVLKDNNNSDFRTWHAIDITALKSEENSPDERYYCPHIIPVIENFYSNGQKQPILENVDDLYKWYAGFLKDLDKDIDITNMSKVVDTLTSNINSELEKVQHIYYWVQKNIKYIAFEYDMGGFIPRRADEVFEKRYGDCKDKASLLYKMLEIAGVKSHFTWIGTMDIPYTYKEVPSPVIDNHMIITYINNGKYYFLDATGENQNINLPTSFIQGKDALIAISEDTFEIVKVPIIDPSRNQAYDSLKISIKEKSILGSGTLQLSGYMKSQFQSNYNYANTEEAKKETLKRYLFKGSNKFFLDKSDVNSIEQFDTLIHIDYTFHLDDYIKSIEDELYINLNLDKSWTQNRIANDRVYPLMFKYCPMFSETVIFDIPEKYTVQYIPADASYQSENFGYTIRYNVVDNQIIYKHDLHVNQLFVPNSEFSQWKEYINSLEKAYKETILLKRNEDIL